MHAQVDFRQLYYRSSHKLDATRAPEPSDMIWANLRYGRFQGRVAIVKSTLLVFLVACVSTVFITTASFFATMHSQGLVTTLWSTPVIILANVAIFVLVPQLALRTERDHTRSSQHLHMLLKMVFFQLFNTVIATLSFLFMRWTPLAHGSNACPLPRSPAVLPPDEACFAPSWVHLNFHPLCVQHWYTTGAAVLINVVIGDLTAILGLIELVRPDKWIIRYLVAPHAPSQAEMNQIYALDSDFYLPFRYQLVLKVVCIAFLFCPAMPILLPLAAVFMLFSYWIDRCNPRRAFKPPPPGGLLDCPLMAP